MFTILLSLHDKSKELNREDMFIKSYELEILSSRYLFLNVPSHRIINWALCNP